MRQDTFQRIAPGAGLSGWRLERRVPLAVLGAIILQCGGVVVWATWQEARLQAVERSQAQQSGLNEKFARLEERIDSLRGDIARLSKQVERVGR